MSQPSPFPPYIEYFRVEGEESEAGRGRPHCLAEYRLIRTRAQSGKQRNSKRSAYWGRTPPSPMWKMGWRGVYLYLALEGELGNIQGSRRGNIGARSLLKRNKRTQGRNKASAPMAWIEATAAGPCARGALQLIPRALVSLSMPLPGTGGLFPRMPGDLKP